MRITSLILLGMTMFFPSLEALSGDGGRTYGDLEGVIYLRNHDGDSIHFDIPGIHPLLGQNIPVRVRGVDAPEIRADCTAEKQLALEARDRVQLLLEKAERITLKETGRDKYFRIVARVEADGVDVGEMLLREGMAVPYDGGRKNKPWCGNRANDTNHQD